LVAQHQPVGATVREPLLLGAAPPVRQAGVSIEVGVITVE